ncbi:hypothetical protein BOX15_Mlig007330g2, partial [Macrostomum lignano]
HPDPAAEVGGHTTSSVSMALPSTSTSSLATATLQQTVLNSDNDFSKKTTNHIDSVSRHDTTHTTTSSSNSSNDKHSNEDSAQCNGEAVAAAVGVGSGAGSVAHPLLQPEHVGLIAELRALARPLRGAEEAERLAQIHK